MKSLLTSLRAYFVFLILCGVIYPLAIYGLGQLFFKDKADGGFLRNGETVIGANLIGQKFESTKYFWPRPSAVDYNAQSSGGSNLGPTSQVLVEAVRSRAGKLSPGGRLTSDGRAVSNFPQGLLYASGSGLDPDLDLASVIFQVDRVAAARGLSDATGVAKLTELVMHAVQHRQMGIFGEETINVLKLNLALDREFASR